MDSTRAFGPSLFSTEAIDADTAAFNAQLEALLGTMPAIHTRQPQEIRDERESGQGIFGPLTRSEMAVERTITGPAGDVPLRMFVPEQVSGIYLHIHGGGWVLGRAHHLDPQLEALARNCGVAVVSVDYSLAPEHRYPTSLEECEAAAAWLIKSAKAEFGSERIVIGGESAGAHLSATTLIRLRDRHGYTGLAGANLVYGVFDLSMTPSQARWGERNLVLSTPIMAWFYDHFVPGVDRRDPDISPLYADLKGLPPALFTVGTLDPLLDDSLFMYSRWIAAGNQADLAIYPGAVHGFTMFPTPLSRYANARMEAFITASIGVAEPV